MPAGAFPSPSFFTGSWTSRSAASLVGGTPAPHPSPFFPTTAWICAPTAFHFFFVCDRSYRWRTPSTPFQSEVVTTRIWFDGPSAPCFGDRADAAETKQDAIMQVKNNLSFIEVSFSWFGL